MGEGDDLSSGTSGCGQFRVSLHRVLIALDEDVGLPCISIDNRAFPMSIEEALWLIENLQIAGYVAAMAND